MSYADFIAGKRIVAQATGISDPPALSDKLFPFQRDIVRWALRRGRAAIWADCGLGKGWMALELARVVAEHTGRPFLILAPLAVAQQFAREGQKLGVNVRVCREQCDVHDGVNVTNYERLSKFDTAAFGGVGLDESSILKDFNSSTRNELIESFGRTPFRYAFSATPAPNDQMELGNHAEFLGAMTRTEMLSMFFVHDGGSTQDWRLKGHARKDFWAWLCSWAVNIRRPSDLGYEDGSFSLPPLRIHEHVVPVGDSFARELGTLFVTQAEGLSAQRAARRSSLSNRVARCAEVVAQAPDRQWLIWCDLNDESGALADAIPGAVEVRGSDDAADKEKALLAFADGSIRVLVTKPSIAGHGMNFQGCHDVAFVGLSNSFEQWYQAIRRTWRFGQTSAVDCHVIISDADGGVRANLERKQRDAETMAAEMLSGMGDVQRATVRGLERNATPYRPAFPIVVPDWLRTEAA